MTAERSAGWREVYESQAVPYPDDPVETGEGAETHGFARAARESKL